MRPLQFNNRVALSSCNRPFLHLFIGLRMGAEQRQRE